MADYKAEQAGAAKLSRINSDVSKLHDMVARIHQCRERVLRHTTALGYFSDDPAKPESATVQPISNNLSNVLGDLDRAIDGLSGALNLFD